MSAIILIPAFFSCWIVARRSASAAFFDVWLPCLMLLPLYFNFRPKHFPPVIFTDMAALPIAVVILALYVKEWKWRWMDSFLLVYVALVFIAEYKHTSMAIGGLEVWGATTTCLFPYVAGRLFLEQPGARAKFLQRFLILLCVVTLLSVWDFAAGTSIFQRFWKHFFPGEIIGWPIQTRWGFGRIAGPYAQSILAGMMFLVGLLLATGMRHFAPDWGRRKVIHSLPITTRALVMLLLVAGLLMTQSRGPVIGALIGLVVIQIARAYRLKRASAVVGIILTVTLFCGYQYIQKYTSGDVNAPITLEQQNAIYRRELLPAYSKIVHDGGMLGWGASNYPKATGQDSIDNQYLLLLVTQGYAGLAVFLLICTGTLWTLVSMLPVADAPQDRWLLFTLISVFVGLLLTLTTVYLGAQIYQVFFLLVGWVQALRSPEMVRLQAERRSHAPLIKVYT
jgi:hypothetical protein